MKMRSACSRHMPATQPMTRDCAISPKCTQATVMTATIETADETRSRIDNSFS